MLRLTRKRRNQQGFALIYVTLMGAFLLIPMAGLAVDFGMLYNIKARLQTACDAAAIGAGYMLHASTNLNDPTQYASITNAAQRYFNANYPTHYFGSTIASYSAVPASSTSGKTITVTASANVPMLLMRVLGITQSTVGAMAISNVRYISMMIVVDRSGSVTGEGASSIIQSALTTFVATSSSSYMVDGTDTVGMVSFGGQWKLDYSPNTHFQSSTPNIGTAINNIPFDSNSSTNTTEGLYQAWYQLYQMNLPGALNVIVLLTDGRPSAFTSYWTPKSSSSCSSKIQRAGVFETYVSLGSYPYWPPPTSPNESTGLYATQYTSTPETSNLAASSAGCAYNSNTANVANDFTSSAFPNSVGPVDNVGSGSGYPPGFSTAGTGLSTQTGYYSTGGNSMTNPKMGRYAAFNAADNLAKLIRQDTTLSPMLFVIGLHYSNTSTEPPDDDWLARVANDPNYVTVGSDSSHVAAGQTVYQTGQTPGMYCSTDNTLSGLNTCFQQVTSHLLRLTM
ncbi:MAG TPA: Tad domain-containing protein [Bryobacteraceae bacterium]|nr:Tad domain-containing protein [Bryobacteraceae bacterium]HUA60348.1 Tad domain-containing protein [Verrucomicrobiae bacterium]